MLLGPAPSLRALLGWLILAQLGLLALGGDVRAQASRDPTLRWRTIRSARFAVHYHTPLEPVARRVAVVAERSYDTLAPLLGHVPTAVTHVVLTDDTDFANGSATALPFNTIRLFASAPEDLSPLGDYDDWLTELVFHESTHVLHLDRISGLPAIVNAIFGKTWAPNAVAPRWFLEGLAVYEETTLTSAGRLRSSIWDMYLRMDALEDRLVRLDQMSNDVDRWPHGNVWYLYGSYFVRYIAERYGPEVFAKMIADYADDAVPYGLNRIARRATGRTFEELYDDFLKERRAHYHAQAAAVRAEGIVEGRRVTWHGEEARMPRWLDARRLVYHAGDNRSLAALRMLTLEAPDAPEPASTPENAPAAETLVEIAGVGAPAPHPDGRRLVYSALDATRDLYAFNDLFVLDRTSGEVERLTEGLRAQEPDVSPDGRRVAFTLNSAGTSHLMVADLADVPGTRRVLVRSARFEQIYTPRWSPDGRTIAYSSWTAGGYRDIRLVDVATGRVTAVTRDRAYDSGPAWSPDGSTLYFSSDRTGIANVYAWTSATGALTQVTNVIAGAFAPAPSPDGRRLAYLGYTTYGWDVFVLRLDRVQPRPAPAWVDTRPPPSETEAVAADLRDEPYDPWPTVRPYNYLLDLTPDAFGLQLGVTSTGGDVVGRHSWSARAAVGLVRGDPTYDLSYAYAGLPVVLSLRTFRSVQPRGGLEVRGTPRDYIEQAHGIDASARYTFRRALASDTIFAGYAVTHLDNLGTLVRTEDLDPNEPAPRLPERGLLAQLRTGWAYSTVRRFAYDISPSEGAFVSLGGSAADPLLGSRFRNVTLTWTGQAYVRNPLWKLHVLALRYAGGVSEGDLGRRGVFGVGGFPQVSIVDQLTQQIFLGGAVLRGYPPNVRVGTQYHLAQVEYRFPLVRPQMGPSTLPFYINRLYAGIFADANDAFSGRLRDAAWRLGTGAELLLDFTLGYFVALTLRVGVAHGWMEGGETQAYANLGVPY